MFRIVSGICEGQHPTPTPSLLLVKTPAFSPAVVLISSGSQVTGIPYTLKILDTLSATSLADKVVHKRSQRPHCFHAAKLTAYAHKPDPHVYCNLTAPLPPS